MFHNNTLTGPRRAVTLMLPFRNGREVPCLGYGTYRLAPDAAADAVDYAIQCGFRHIDCAKVYGNQAAVGEGIRRAMKRLKLRREDLFSTGKLWPTDQHPDRVAKACQETLDELKTDYLDLFLVHWPVAWKNTGKWETDADKYPVTASGNADVDDSVKLTDTWAEMERLVDTGKAFSLGLSNSGDDELRQLRNAKHGVQTNQVEAHPANQQLLLRSSMSRDQILLSCYCPLGNPTRFTPEGFQGVCKHEFFAKLRDLTGFTTQRLILNWSVDNYNVVLVKAQTKKHIEDNAKVSTGMLSDAQRRMVQGHELINGNIRVINPTTFRADGKPFFPRS